jgi:long-chain acyl-CoA synthetase
VIAESRPEWCVSDLAVLAAGSLTVPVYPTLTSGQVRYILNDCRASLAVVSNRVQVEKIAAVRTQLPRLSAVVVMDIDGRPWPEGVVPLSDVGARGHSRLISDAAAGPAFADRSAAITRDSLATIIYTSGTTGKPKGVMLTHGNILSNVEAALSCWACEHEWLPFRRSAAFERMVLYTYLYAGASVALPNHQRARRDSHGGRDGCSGPQKVPGFTDDGGTSLRWRLDGPGGA